MKHILVISNTALACFGLAATLMAASPATTDSRAVVRLRGAEFRGGAPEAVAGGGYRGISSVNAVYAASTGDKSSMHAEFALTAVPDHPLVLHVQGCDDDLKGPCPIEITLNGHPLLKGPSGFPDNDYAWRAIPIPPKALKAGTNELVVRNTAPEGQYGMPPWFILARAIIAGADYDVNSPPPITEDFRVDLPKEARQFPEPLPKGKEPGFKWRGIKTWMWSPQQCLAEIPVLARYKMNFFMNCYTSMCDVENYKWGDPNVNRWWEDLPAWKMKAYEEIVRSCSKHGLNFCFSMNPNLCTKRLLRYDSAEDLDLLWKHYAWMQGLGVQWFNIQCDDITQGIDATGQAKFANEFLRRLRMKDPRAQMIFCPTIYWGNGKDPKEKAYLEELNAHLDKDVIITWTGDGVVGQITRAAAESYKSVLKHRLWVCDNYPVNDANPTMHLGPAIRRDQDLCEVVEGFYANVMCPQNEINRVPLLTVADYTWNPYDYDPARSIGQTIVHLADTNDQRQALRDLVELYPGMILAGQGTAWNPVLTRFNRILDEPHSRYMARIYLRHIQDVATRLDKAFPDRFKDAVKTLQDNIAKMKSTYETRYGRSE